jgi:hypothetical protein
MWQAIHQEEVSQECNSKILGVNHMLENSVEINWKRTTGTKTQSLCSIMGGVKQ